MSEPAPPRGRKAPRPPGRQTLSHQLRQAILDRPEGTYAIAQRADIDPKLLARFVAGSRGLSLATADRIGLALGLRLGIGLARTRRPDPARVAKANA